MKVYFSLRGCVRSELNVELENKSVFNSIVKRSKRAELFEITYIVRNI